MTAERAVRGEEDAPGIAVEPSLDVLGNVLVVGGGLTAIRAAILSPVWSTFSTLCFTVPVSASANAGPAVNTSAAMLRLWLEIIPSCVSPLPISLPQPECSRRPRSGLMDLGPSGDLEGRCLLDQGPIGSRGEAD